MESVLDDCKNQGLNIPAVCFDGQWHTITTRSIINFPLTLLQQPNDTWKEAEKKQKSEIIKEFANLNTEFQFHFENGVMICTNGGSTPPRTTCIQRKIKSNDAQMKLSANEIKLTNLVPKEVLEDNEVPDEVLAYVSLQQSEVNEIASCIISMSAWRECLNDITTEDSDEVPEHEKVQENQEYSEEESIMETQDLNADPNSPVQSPDNIHNNTGATGEKFLIIQSLEKDMPILLELLRADRFANKKGA